MHKKSILFYTLLCCVFNLNAQVKNEIKLGIEPGFLLLSSSENLGLFLNIEPKLKIAENTFAGLRIAMVLNPQKFENYDHLQFEVADEFDNGGISFVPTLDYSFKERSFKRNFFRPYVGFGVGVYLLTKYVDVVSNTSASTYEVEVSKQFGALFRVGLESNRLRFGLEYNLVRKADMELPNGQVIGTVDNSYLGLSFGYLIGLGMI